MKKLILAALMLLVPMSAFAQDDTQDMQYLELLRQDLKTQKVALVTEAMQLTDAEGEAFWPIYREYEHELSGIGDRRIANIKNYAETYMSMDDATATQLIDTAFKIDADRSKIEKKYYKKVAKEVNPIVAARWAQVEHQIGLLIDLQIASELPLITKAAATAAASEDSGW